MLKTNVYKILMNKIFLYQANFYVQNKNLSLNDVN